MPSESKVIHAQGVVQSMRVHPSSDAAQKFEAVVHTEHPTYPSIRLIWLGQPRIRAIVPGARLGFSGRLGVPEAGLPMMYNPRYELLFSPAAKAVVAQA